LFIPMDRKNHCMFERMDGFPKAKFNSPVVPSLRSWLLGLKAWIRSGCLRNEFFWNEWEIGFMKKGIFFQFFITCDKKGIRCFLEALSFKNFCNV